MPASNLRIYPFVKHNQPELFDKLEKHGVTIQDVLHVCRGWEVLHDVRRDGVSWRYKICGRNCDNKWMAVVLAVNNHSDVIVVVLASGRLWMRMNGYGTI